MKLTIQSALLCLGFAAALALHPEPLQAKTAPKLSCADTDGRSAATYGTVTVKNNKKTFRYVDTCLSKTKVREAVCAKQNIVFVHIACAKGFTCSAGACVAPITAPKIEVAPVIVPIAPPAAPAPAAPTIITPPVVTTPPITITPISTPNPTPPPAPAAPALTPGGVFLSAESPLSGSITQTVTAGTSLGLFKITNQNSFAITLTDLTVTDNGSHTGSLNYRLHFSDIDSPNYTGNTAVASNASLVFSSLSISLPGNTSRYLSVALPASGSLTTGDSFNLSVASLGHGRYSVTEADLGVDNNKDGDLADTITGLFVDGKPTLGTLIKQ